MLFSLQQQSTLAEKHVILQVLTHALEALAYYLSFIDIKLGFGKTI